FQTNVNEDGDSYKYTFVICGQVNASTNTYAGLVQSKADSPDTVIGRINDTHLINGTDWIMLFYKSGDKYDNHCGKGPRQALVMISCNKNTLGDAFTMISEERNKTSDCFYLFEMDSSVACPAEESHLSVGSILLIVMAVTLCADLGPGPRRPPTVEWEMISLGKSQKREMTTYYLCEIQFPTTSPDVLQMEETTLSTTFLPAA
ncbi:hypothetical protein AB205_0065030, partial [Aquarana catesbeiana]